MRRQWLPLAALAAVVAGAAYLRLAHLGANELWNDELYHYFAAQSLNAGRGPLLPSGEVYGRGIDITRLVAVALRHVSPIETASRLPAALFGILNVILFAAITWRIAGPWAAVGAAVLLAIYPEAVFQSRYARFYTYQLNFGLLALYGGWQVVRLAGLRRELTTAEQRAAWAWAGVTAGALALAGRIHVTTLSVVIALGVAVALAAGADLWARGRRAWHDSAPLYLTVTGLTSTAAVYLLARGWIDWLVASSQFSPLWRRRLAPGGGSPLEYYWALADAYPTVISLAPLVFLVVAIRNWRLAAYLFTWFAVPFALHSALLPWKQERFILLAVPALLLAAGIAAAVLFERQYAAVFNTLGSWGRSPRARRLGAGAAVALTAVFMMLTTPAFGTSRKMSTGYLAPSTTARHAAVARVLREIPGVDTIPLGSGSPLRSLLYWPRLDFVVRRTFLEQPIRTVGGAAGWMRLHPEGTPDFYSGLPVIPSPAGIRERFASRGGVIILPDRTEDSGGPQLLETLRHEAVEICRGRCGTAELYYWKFSPPPPAVAGGDRPALRARLDAPPTHLAAAPH